MYQLPPEQLHLDMSLTRFNIMPEKEKLTSVLPFFPDPNMLLSGNQ
jgi:hypothetical protein